MTGKVTNAKRASVAIAMCAALSAENASAEPVTEFYKGKDIKVIIGFAAGGGYDVYARAVTKYMQKHVPGNPNMVPQNLTGAGSRRAANFLFNVAPKDGTVFGTVAQSVALDQVVGESGVMYDANRFTWIGNSIADNNITAVWSTTGITTVAEAKQKGGVICGATGGTSPAVTAPQIINNLIGTNFKIIRGYPGGSVINLALDRGEVNCRGSNSWSSTKSTQADQLKSGKLNIILQWGAKRDPEISKFMGREVPNITEFAKTDADRKALDIIISGVSIGRPLLGPPDIPAERVAALREAFDKTMTDPAFLEFAKKSQMDINPVSGAELQKLVAQVISAPPIAVKRMQELLTQRDVTELQLQSAEGSIVRIDKRVIAVKDAAGKLTELRLNPKQTKVTIKGEAGKVAALTENMNCKFKYFGINGEVESASCN